MSDPSKRSDWRAMARLQRDTFEKEQATAASFVFRDLGTLRTWKKKHRWLAERLWAANPGWRCLELGTGEGLGHDDPAGYPGTHVGIDPADSALVRARARWRRALPNAPSRWVAGFAEELPFRDASFDAVFGIDTLHHVASLPAAFAEMARVLRPGGVITFVEPNPLFPVNLLLLASKVERGIYDLTHQNLRACATAAGLVEFEIGNVPTYLPSFPGALSAAYEAIEGILGRLPVVCSLSTGRTIVARRPR